MKLNILPLSQRDSRWKDQRLGTVNGTTIGGYGCIITCMSMLANYYGHKILPNEMDDWLTDSNNKGYIQGNLYRNDAFAREFPDCSFINIIQCTDIPAPLTKIDEQLFAGHPVVVMVDFDHDPSDGTQTHFLLVKGKTDDGRYIVNDPWYGDEVFIDARYGAAATAINQINMFSGPLPVIAPPPSAHTQSAEVPDTSASSAGSAPTELTNSTDEQDYQLQTKYNFAFKVLGDIHNIVHGSGYSWTKISKLKQILPK